LPFFVEIFDKVLDGRSIALLDPYLDLRKRWGLEIWVPSLEATVSFRLALRQPEGISHFNAPRLNSLIRENRESLDFGKVNSILRKWDIEQWVEKNL
jgi:hypothetical protein